MTNDRQTDISEILGEIASVGPLLSTHRARLEILMRHFQRAGLTIEICADSKHLNRSISTVKGYARALSLRFPDYIPLHMRTVEENKRKKPTPSL